MILKMFFIIILITQNSNTQSPIQNNPVQNCPYENTINITGYPQLDNGSYIYSDDTIDNSPIPSEFVGLYDYEGFNDGSRVPVPPHMRACLCNWKHCITLCSNNILEFHKYIFHDNDTDNMAMFYKNVTLKNGTVVTKDIVKDFKPMVMQIFCASYRLSPENNPELGWTLFENGTLLPYGDNAYLSISKYCFEVYMEEFNNVSKYFINPYICGEEVELSLIEKINNWTQIISLPFFLLTILAYGCLPELRDVHGKCFMSYLICLALSYSLLSLINLSNVRFSDELCIFMGYLIHFTQLGHYTWLGVISYDTWRSFSDMTYKSKYLTYSLYGWLIPLLLTFMTCMAQIYVTNDKFTPGITENHCGLDNNRPSATFYLYGPCFIILIYCFILFVFTSRTLQLHKKEINQFTEMRCDSQKLRYTLYLRLFLMMGLSWSLDAISFLFFVFHYEKISFYIDCINALQGLYIFINFIGRRRVRDVIKERFLMVKKKVWHRKQEF